MCVFKVLLHFRKKSLKQAGNTRPVLMLRPLLQFGQLIDLLRIWISVSLLLFVIEAVFGL